jgi:hypothetical protein
LIVENDDGVRNLLGNVFEGEGYLFSMVKIGAEMRRGSTRMFSMLPSSM